MRRRLLRILVCPSCRGPLELVEDVADPDDVREGMLQCTRCGVSYPIVRGIPRFVDAANYARSFGFQWDRFRYEQLDSASGTTLSRDRFFAETRWEPETLRGKLVLDAGSGAGRFLEIALKTGADVVGLDLSGAVDSAAMTLGESPRLHLVQGSIDRPPFRAEAFDAVYCIGVIQHTSDPEATVRALARLVTPGGRLAVTAYEKRRFTHLYSKYWARRLTRGLDDRQLLGLVRLVMPILFPLTEILFRIPLLGRVFQFAIPVANYVHERRLSLRQRYRVAVLDTFDMLAPAYDRPQREPELRRWLRDEGLEAIERLPNPGLNLVGRRAAAPRE